MSNPTNPTLTPEELAGIRQIRAALSLQVQHQGEVVG